MLQATFSSNEYLCWTESESKDLSMLERIESIDVNILGLEEPALEIFLETVKANRSLLKSLHAVHCVSELMTFTKLLKAIEGCPPTVRELIFVCLSSEGVPHELIDVSRWHPNLTAIRLDITFDATALKEFCAGLSVKEVPLRRLQLKSDNWS